jgi:hypothetical protein
MSRDALLYITCLNLQKELYQKNEDKNSQYVFRKVPQKFTVEFYIKLITPGNDSIPGIKDYKKVRNKA